MFEIFRSGKRTSADTDKTQVCYWIYENATNKAAEVTVNFVAVGRWK